MGCCEGIKRRVGSLCALWGMLWGMGRTKDGVKERGRSTNLISLSGALLYSIVSTEVGLDFSLKDGDFFVP